MTIAIFPVPWAAPLARPDRINPALPDPARVAGAQTGPDAQRRFAAAPAPRADRSSGDVTGTPVKPPLLDLHFPDPLPELPKLDPAPAVTDYHSMLPILRGGQG